MLLITRRIRHINRIAIKKAAASALIISALILGGCSKVSDTAAVTPTAQAIVSADDISAEQNRPDNLSETNVNPIFAKEDIPDAVKEKMLNVTISDSSPVSFSDLSYLTITYIGYDDAVHTGNMVIDKTLADDALDIFKELYAEGFPIEKIRLACEYGGSDELSMEDNNTSCFNDRPIEGTNTVSNHALGRAIDINPLINPYIKGDTLLPVTAGQYLDRGLNEKGIITADGICVRIFKSHGWEWGGDWNSLKDYQHFEKPIDED